MGNSTNLQKEIYNSKRNYDKEPIIVKDYNSLFPLLGVIYIIPILIWVYFFNPGGLSEKSLSLNILVIMPLLMLPFILPYYKSRNKRKVVLTNEYIKFFHNEILLESINLNDITKINKTYSDIYHKSQYPNDFSKMLGYLVFPIYGLTQGLLILNKFLFHIYKDGYKSYRFYDSAIIFSNDRFINILPTTLNEYLEIQEYLVSKKKINLNETKAYYYFFTMSEKITL